MSIQTSVSVVCYWKITPLVLVFWKGKYCRCEKVGHENKSEVANMKPYTIAPDQLQFVEFLESFVTQNFQMVFACLHPFQFLNALLCSGSFISRHFTKDLGSCFGLWVHHWPSILDAVFKSINRILTRKSGCKKDSWHRTCSNFRTVFQFREQPGLNSTAVLFAHCWKTMALAFVQELGLFVVVL